MSCDVIVIENMNVEYIHERDWTIFFGSQSIDTGTTKLLYCTTVTDSEPVLLKTHPHFFEDSWVYTFLLIRAAH